nr:DUF4241 domain-containing protein [Streptomyces zhaozhouensis]
MRCGTRRASPCQPRSRLHAEEWTERYAYDTAGDLTHAEWPAEGVEPFTDEVPPGTYPVVLSVAEIARPGDASYAHERAAAAWLRIGERPAAGWSSARTAGPRTRRNWRTARGAAAAWTPGRPASSTPRSPRACARCSARTARVTR